MLLRFFLGKQDLLKVQVGLVEHLLEMNFMLRLGRDRIAH